MEPGFPSGNHFSISSNSYLDPKEPKSNPKQGLNITLLYNKTYYNISFLILVIEGKQLVWQPTNTQLL
jgi:hypothetical protein